MPLLKSIRDKGATVAWSPLGGNASSLMATATKEGAGGGFDDYGGDLEIYDLQLNAPDDVPAKLISAVHTSARFNCIAWGEPKMHTTALPLGLLAGGMADGVVNIFDPNKMLQGAGEAAIIGKVTNHKGNVNALQFNPHAAASHLLASGSSDTEVFITDLQRPDTPGTGMPAPKEAGHHLGEITSLAWNTQVQHIIASASQRGSCIIWDLRNKKPWGKIKDPNGSVYSSIAWNPADGMQFITATDDDMRPIIRLYDLRATMSTPLAELSGHTQGILGMSWCPYDPSLLMTCSKDNRTLLWDLQTYKSVYELPAESSEPAKPASATNADSFFGAPGGGGGMMAGGNRRYDVRWSPRKPAVISTCSFDRKVQVYSVTGQGSARGPKWLRCPTNAAFGFGGKLVSMKDNKVFINKVKTDDSMAVRAEQFENAISVADLKPFCDFKVANAISDYEKETWNMLKIHFQDDARQMLLNHLGFDSAQIAAEVAKFTDSTATDDSSATTPNATNEVEGEAPAATTTTIDAAVTDSASTPASAEDMFAGPPEGIFDAPAPAETEPEVPANNAGNNNKITTESPSPNSDDVPNTAAALAAIPEALDDIEVLIKRALMVGNFQAAVDACLSSDKLALALLIATYGGADMWKTTQEAFFRLQQRPFMNVVKAIVKGELTDLVATSGLDSWQETLAVVSTYAKAGETQELCNQLGGRLESERGDDDAASLCYLVAMNVEKTIEIWEKKADTEALIIGGQQALQNLVEKVSVFLKALGDDSDTTQRIGDSMAGRFGKYALILVEQGRFDIANKYATLVKSMPAGKILLDRIYHSTPHWDGDGSVKPENPFETTSVTAAAATAATPAAAPISTSRYDAASTPAGYAATTTGAGAYGASTSTATTTSSYGTAGYGGSNTAVGGYAGAGYSAGSASGYGVGAAAGYGAAATGGYAGGYNNAGAATTSGFSNGSGSSTGGYGGAATAGYGAGTGYGGGATNSSPYAKPMAPNTGGRPLASQSGRNISNTIPTNDGFQSSVGNQQLAAKYGNGAYNPAAALSAGWTAPTTSSINSSINSSGAAGAWNNPNGGGGSTPVMSTQLHHHRDSIGGGNAPSIFNPAASMAAQSAAAAAPAPVEEPVAPPVPAVAPGITDEFKVVIEGLEGLIKHLQSLGLSPAEQRQIQSGAVGIEVLKEKLVWRKLSDMASSKLMEMHTSLSSGNMRGALAIHKKLTDSKEWKSEKDWLKGLKFVLQVGIKRFNL